jgi:quercetin dioxygenase-like cupin family protein
MAQNVPPRSRDTRLVVTGHDEKGNAVILQDACNEAKSIGDGTHLNTLWSSSEFPASVDGDEKEVSDPADATKGSFFNTYDLPPNYNGPMHRKITLDYIVVLQGEVVLTLQDGNRVILTEGDTTVQQSTMHSWSNESDKWARILSIMLPAKPPIIGNKELEPVWPF